MNPWNDSELDGLADPLDAITGRRLVGHVRGIRDRTDFCLDPALMDFREPMSRMRPPAGNPEPTRVRAVQACGIQR